MTRTTRRNLTMILGCTLTVLVAWASTRGPRQEVLFTTAEACRQDLRGTVSANGEVQALTKVNVGTTVTGEIRTVHVKDGQWVRAGDLLITLDQERSKQELNRADLGLRMTRMAQEKTQLGWTKLEGTFKRMERLFQEKLISAEDFQQAKLDRDNAVVERDRARTATQQALADVALCQDALDKTVVRASITGRVTGLKAEKGETAVAGQVNIAGAVLMVIARMDDLLAEVRVGELEVVKLKAGQPAEIQVDALPGKVFQGAVLDVATSVERPPMGGFEPSAGVQNYRVRVRILGPPAERAALRPGMSARVAVLAQEVAGALTVPLQALQEREGRPGEGLARRPGLGLLSSAQPVVFTVNQGVVEERRVTTGVSTRQAVEVLAGLREGEELITGPAKAVATLRPGARVRTLPEAEALRLRRP